MPFRFRKIFSLGKGFRINLSKGGVSSSLGVPGATVNFGKRGARSTLGIPGSGLSYTTSMAGGTTEAKSNILVNLITLVISGTLIILISCCCLGVLFMPGGSEEKSPSATPQVKQEISIEQVIALTFNAAQAQTLAVASPLPTSTIAALETVPPSATLIQIQLQVMENTPLPVYETSTPFILATLPANGSGSGACSCSSDSKNCSDFQTHAQAQACFSYCVSQGAGDIHKLDQNADGSACESLP